MMTNLTGKQVVYLALAVLGVGWTWYYNLQLPEGVLANIFVEMFSTPLTSTLSADITVALLTWLFWMLPEARRLNMRWWTVAGLVISSFSIAFAFAFPMFMFLRERALLRAGLDE